MKEMTKFPKCLEMPNFYERVRLCKKYGIIYVRGGRLKQRISLQFIEQALTLAENKGRLTNKEINVRFKWGKGVADHVIKIETENEKQKKRIAQLEKENKGLKYQVKRR